MSFDADVVRAQFPILDQQVNGKPLVYLDSAASAQKPQMVLDTMSSAYSQTYANVHRGLHYLSEASTDAYEAVRGKVAHLIGASSEKEIVFTSGATMALNLIAHCYGNTNLGEGDEVLISVADHHANIVPWHLLGGRVGSKTVAAPVDADGSFNMEQFKAHITPRTKIISVPHVSNVLGTVFP
ncbi:MAG: aminotransferase class V-fold PLP-dependent enzyme, partial [Pseudomonadota bacterium]|nr:aminotransferase class V-fold PLP-dependent enzyme [Pseudomonadota bacterium]